MSRITRRGFITACGALAVTGVAGARRTHPIHPTFATYNITDLTTKQVQSPGDEQAAAAARVIQEVRPDVLALNELVNNEQENGQAAPSNVRAFIDNYLNPSQADHLDGIDYAYSYAPPSNTGVHSGMDLDNNGTIDDSPGDRTYGNDAFGFGEYPGQYALAIVSRYPIQENEIRSFRTFRWKDMPNSNIVLDSSHDVYLTESEAQRFRLSSKTHVDVPISIGGRTVHTLLAHPTPPVFDGPENFNGKRNHDEVRLLADYVAGEDYLVDDDGTQGGLTEDATYVLLGDMNASLAGDENRNAAEKFFIENEDFNTRWLPISPGGAVKGSPYITAEFGLKVDYVLPSPDLLVHNSAVIWPVRQSKGRGLGEAVRTASDHRLVWATVSRLPHL